MDEIATARNEANALRATLRALDTDSGDLVSFPIEALIADLGIDIAHFAAADYPTTLGFLDAEEDLIWVRSDLPAVTRRFTLAHELGHHQLHRYSGDRCAPDDLSNNSTLRVDEAYSPRSRREREANAFAAELLAPLASVRTGFLGDAQQPALSPATIAARLGISTDIIVRQITRLLLTPDAQPDPDVAAPAAPPVLDVSQQAAVAATTPALIVAGPGTGKTSTLVGRVLWLVEHGTPPNKILALTFSRKAAREMQARIRATLAGADQLPNITTFHRFGGDLLRQYGHLVALRPDFRLIDEIGALFLLRDLGPQLPLDYFMALADPTQHFGMILAAIAKAKDELVGPPHYALLAAAMATAATTPEQTHEAARMQELAAIYAVYQGELDRRGDVDYGDLISKTVAVLRDQPQVLAQIREQAQHVLVDELQDINHANGVLLQVLAGPEGHLWAVGDANQAIYRFRGASPANLANFTQDYPQAQVLSLDYNYRSRPAIVEAANRFAAAQLTPAGTDPAPGLIATREPTSMSMRLRVATDGDHEIAALAAEIQDRLAHGAAPGDVAVICRTRAQVSQVADALALAQVPTTARTDCFDDPAIKDLLGIVHLLAGEPGGWLRAARVPDHPLSMTTVATVLDVMRRDHLAAAAACEQTLPLLTADRQALERIHESMRAMRSAPDIGSALASYCLTFTHTAQRMLVTGAEEAAHLGELLLLAQRFDEERPGNVVAWDERRWREFTNFLRAVRPMARDANTAEDDALAIARVQVLTVHGAKGLEWPIVYLPNLAKVRFPLARRAERAPHPDGLVTGEPTDLSQAHMTDEACLFYVAITRARDELVLSRAERYGKMHRNPSPFLEPLGTLPTERIPVTDAPDAIATTGDTFAVPFDNAGRVAFSASEIDTYDRCPRQFAYRYGLGTPARRGSYGRLRRAVTATLQAAHRTALDEAALVQTFEQHWVDGAGAEDQGDPFVDLFWRQGRAAIEHSGRRIQPGTSLRADFARSMQVMFDESTIALDIDRVDVPMQRPANTIPGYQSDVAPTPAAAVRHQLGRRSTEPEPDLRHYLTVLAQRALTGDEEADTITEHHLLADVLVSITLTPRVEARLRTRLRAAIAGIRAGDFSPDPETRRCATCEFALICPME